MTILWDMPLTELVSAAFFLLTAVLLLYATAWRYRAASRLAALAAIASAGAANTFMVMSYRGEAAFTFERPGPIKRKSEGERGTFAFENEGTAGSASSAGGRGAGVSGSRSDGRDDGSVEMALQRAVDDCPACPEMVVIRPGVFTMGAAPNDPAANASERPTRLIGFARPFAIGRSEVTIEQYAAFAAETARTSSNCRHALSGDDDPHWPVSCVSAEDADAFAAWLAKRTGKPFRLPSEAEWEYAARGGATTAFATGDQIDASEANIARSVRAPVPVGSYRPNAFGLVDIHGNAAEIVGGCWTPSPALVPGDGRASGAPGCEARVVRDGHAGEGATSARLSTRRPIAADARIPGMGFRLARDLK
jgi:formylglycine-generating enzyme required for sulfatase activity